MCDSYLISQLGGVAHSHNACGTCDKGSCKVQCMYIVQSEHVNHEATVSWRLMFKSSTLRETGVFGQGLMCLLVNLCFVSTSRRCKDSQ